MKVINTYIVNDDEPLYETENGKYFKFDFAYAIFTEVNQELAKKLIEASKNTKI